LLIWHNVEIMSLTQIEAPAISADIGWLDQLAPDQIPEVRRDLLALQSEANLLPEVSAQVGLSLRFDAIFQLREEAMLNNHRTSGLARASYHLGKVINRAIPTDALLADFAPSFIDEDKAYVLERSSQQAAGSSGYYLRMLTDLLVVKKDSEVADDYIELQSRNPQDRLKTGNGLAEVFKAGSHETAFCNESDLHFAESGFTDKQLKSIEIDGQLVALQKSEGDHVAILTRQAVLNGVRLPAGSLMTVEQPKHSGGNPLFAFGRLSSFCFPTPGDAARAMPALVANISQPSRKLNFAQALANFNQLSGRAPEPVQGSSEEHAFSDAAQWQAAQKAATFTLAAALSAHEARQRRKLGQPQFVMGLYNKVADSAQARFEFVDSYGRYALEVADHLLLDPITDRLAAIAPAN
jgi:hypothetical protein